MTARARADEVETRNGDRYAGNVLSLNGNTLVMQSEVLGKVQIARSNIVLITLGAVTTTNPAQRASAANARVVEAQPAIVGNNPEISPPLGQLAGQTNLIQQVQKMFLGDLGPEANDKFNELLGGFLSGKLTVDDIRAQAKTAVQQARAIRNDLGENGGPLLDRYVSILEKFLDETVPSDSITNAPSKRIRPGGLSP